jgi:hypothetical protein
MSTFPVEPPVTPAAQASEVPAGHRRALSQEELATLPLQALLVRAGHVTLDQLAEALRENVATGRAVEDIALSRGWISVEDLTALRTAKASFPSVQAPAAPAPAAQPPAPAPAPVAPAPPAPAPVAEAPMAPAAVAPPPAAPAPVAQAPMAPAPLVEAPAPPPHLAEAPAVEAPAARREVGPDKSVGVFLNLEDGARIWAGRFDSIEAAERHAQQLTESLVRPEPGVWPRFGDQLVRPDAVVSIEVSPREER